MGSEALFWPAVIVASAMIAGLLVWNDVARSTRGAVVRMFHCPLEDRLVTTTFRADFLAQFKPAGDQQ